MTKGNLYKQILLFSIPLMASSLLQLLFNAADIVVVGKFAGDQSLAAVSSTTSIVSLVVNAFIGISVGTNVVIAKHLGADNTDDSKKAVATSIAMSLLFGIVLTFVGIFISRPILQAMDTPYDVIDLSALYLKIYFLGSPANLIYNFGAAILRSKGDTRRPLYFLGISGILNVILNLILVIVFQMDVAGVAIATITSQYTSAALVLLTLSKEDESIRFYPSQIKIDKEQLHDILAIGIPSGMQSIAFSLSNVIIQSSVNSFGSVVMAGCGAASNIGSFAWALMNAFSQAAQTFGGQNLGAGNIKRIQQTFYISFLYVTIIGLIAGIGGWYFGETLLGIYTDSPEVIVSGMIRLKYFLLPYVIFGQQDVVAGAARGLGSSVAPMVCTLIFTCALRVLWVWIPFRIYPTIENLYLSYPISWIFTLIFQLVIFFKVYNKVTKSA